MPNQDEEKSTEFIKQELKKMIDLLEDIRSCDFRNKNHLSVAFSNLCNIARQIPVVTYQIASLSGGER